MSNTIKVKTYPMSQILNKITNKTTVVDQLILIASVHRKKRFNPITIVKKTINSSICGPNFFPIHAPPHCIAVAVVDDTNALMITSYPYLLTNRGVKPLPLGMGI